MQYRLAFAWIRTPIVLFLVALSAGCGTTSSASEPDGAAPDVTVPTDGSSGVDQGAASDDAEAGAPDTAVANDARSEADVSDCACSPTGTGPSSRGSMSLPCFCAMQGTRCYSYDAAPAGCVANGGTGKIDFYESCRLVVMKMGGSLFTRRVVYDLDTHALVGAEAVDDAPDFACGAQRINGLIAGTFPPADCAISRSRDGCDWDGASDR